MSDLVLQRLSVDNLEDFLDYFDHRAFLNDPNWDGCYCQFYLGVPETLEPGITEKERNRSLACDRVNTGKMEGYLLFQGEQMVGWCAAGNSLLYPAFPDADEKLARILCFNIDPVKRGAGLAGQMLDLVLEDLASRGFAAAEAAPNSLEVSDKSYRGTVNMFQERGFERIMELGDGFVLMKRYFD